MTHRSGFIGIIGLPNAGKSTLLNSAMRQKLSIISSKPQTTRNRVLGVLNLENAQAALMDTPGIHRPRGRLHRTMVKHAEEIIPDMDAICWVVDCIPLVESLERGKNVFSGGLRHIFGLVKDCEKVAIALNKVDKVKKPLLLPLLQDIQSQCPQAELVPICARKGDNVEALITVLTQMLPEAPPMFPKDQLTDVSERFLVGELVREKVFVLTNQEIPYSVAVEVEKFTEEENAIEIFARIWVERDSQKGIVIGKGGKLLKEVGVRARKDIELLLGVHVRLNLHVSVKGKWTDNPNRLRELGYE
jgi:GTPase